MLGKTVSDLQTDVAVADGKITGTLIYNEGWESGPLAGPGYYMALKFSSEDWDQYDSIMVGLDPSIGTGLVEVKNDPDRNGVFKVVARDVQKFVVQTRDRGSVIVTQYSLEDLIFQEPGGPYLTTVPNDDDLVSYNKSISVVQSNINVTDDGDDNYTVSGTLLPQNDGMGNISHALYLKISDDAQIANADVSVLGIASGSEPTELTTTDYVYKGTRSYSTYKYVMFSTTNKSNWESLVSQYDYIVLNVV